jgi:hypothetical protein
MQIVSQLADDLEPDRDGLRSVSMVAREMVRFCSLSKELYEALPGALSRLGPLSRAFTSAPSLNWRKQIIPSVCLPRDVDWQLILHDRKVLDKAASSSPTLGA